MKSSDFQNIIAKSRADVARYYSILGDEINVAERCRRSIQQKPWAWLGGAISVGLVTAFLGGSPSSKNSKKLVKELKKKNAASGSSAERSKAASVAALVLGGGGVTSMLLPTVRFLIPLLKPVVTSYAAKKINHISSHR